MTRACSLLFGMEWVSHKAQLFCSSLLGALVFAGFVFFIRKKAKKLKNKSQLSFERNEMEDYSPEVFELQETSLSPFVVRVTNTIEQLVEVITREYPPSYPFVHHSVYYGSGGLSFLFWRLFRSQTRDTALREKYLTLSQQVLVVYHKLGIQTNNRE